jgi:hypothetical protein
VNDILKIVNSIIAGNPEEEIERFSSGEKSNKIKQEIINLTQSGYHLIIDKIYDGQKDSYKDFFDRVSSIDYYIGHHNESREFIGNLISDVYSNLPPNQNIKFINEILNLEMHFWTILHCLPFVFKKIILPANFACTFFTSINERIKNDLAGGDFWDAIENYVFSFPSNALEIFNIYENQLSNETAESLASLILGHLRNTRKLEEEIKEIDEQLKSNQDVNKRKCYYGSISISHRNGYFSLEQLSTLLDDMLKDESEKIKEIAFWTVQRIVFYADSNLIDFTINWFDKKGSANISAQSKHYIISSMWHLCSKVVAKEPIDYKIANKIIVQVLPISNECLGTLEKLEDYLDDRLKKNDEFENTVLCLIDNGIENLFCLLKHDNFKQLKRNLQAIDLTNLISELIFSGDINKCKVGLFILEYCKITPFTDKTLLKIDDNNKEIALTESIKGRHFHKSVIKKVQFFEPFFEEANKELQKDFIDEIVIQAVNYPKGCLEELKRLNQNDLISKIVKRAEKYFDGLKKVHNSPANAFSFPGYKDACLKSNSRFQAEIRKSSTEQSVLLKLFSSVQLIYGQKFSFSRGETVSEPSPFAHFEETMEMPRIEIIDPEGMALRRFQD